MENLFEPEGQTTSDNFSMSENENFISTPQSDWGGLSADDNAYLSKKGLKSPADLLHSYRALEKAYSSKFSLPKDGDEEGFQKLYSRLGMPGDTASYELNFDEEDKPFLEEFKEACLKNNVLPKSAQGLYDWFVNNRKSQNQKNEQNWLDQSAIEMTEQQSEWGAQSVRNMELMRRGIRLFVQDDDSAVDDIERALGTKKMMQVFCRLGEAVSEDNPISFGNGAKRTDTFNLVEHFKEMFNDY